jgi:hypothetical protein
MIMTEHIHLFWLFDFELIRNGRTKTTNNIIHEAKNRLMCSSILLTVFRARIEVWLFLMAFLESIFWIYGSLLV